MLPPAKPPPIEEDENEAEPAFHVGSWDRVRGGRCAGTARNRPMLCGAHGLWQGCAALVRGRGEPPTLWASRGDSFTTVQMRLAWFTPLAPVRSGIASYSAMVLPALAAAHDIAVFVGDDVWAARRPEATRRHGRVCRGRTRHGARSARRTTSRRCIRRAPFDLMVYQLGNAGCHDHMWALPHALSRPGRAARRAAAPSRAQRADRARPGRTTARRAALRPSGRAARASPSGSSPAWATPARRSGR